MFTFLNNIFNRIAVIIIVGLTAICFYQNNKINKLDDKLGIVTNNYQYYQSLTSGLDKQNNVLKLTIDDLNMTNDSLLQEVNEVREELKIKDKNVQQVQIVKTEVKDSIKTVIKPTEIDFTKELKLNNLTTIIVSKRDSILSAVLDLKNQQTLFVERKRKYRNQYKNWFQRLIHFDWKKDDISNYTIHNSNDLIKVTDTRVIEIL